MKGLIKMWNLLNPVNILLFLLFYFLLYSNLFLSSIIWTTYHQQIFIYCLPSYESLLNIDSFCLCLCSLFLFSFEPNFCPSYSFQPMKKTLSSLKCFSICFHEEKLKCDWVFTLVYQKLYFLFHFLCLLSLLLCNQYDMTGIRSPWCLFCFFWTTSKINFTLLCYPWSQMKMYS